MSSLNSLESRKQQQRRFDAQNEAAARKIKDSLGMYKPESERDMMDRLMPPGPSSVALLALNGVAAFPATSKVLRPSTNASNENGTALRPWRRASPHLKVSSEAALRARRKGPRSASLSIRRWRARRRGRFDRCRADSWVERANAQLRKQVHEMESFLQDYGLVWVGQEQTSAEAASEGETAESIGARIDFGLLFARLKELNVLAGEGKAKIRTEAAARFDFGENSPRRVQGRDFSGGAVPAVPDRETQRFVSDVLMATLPNSKTSTLTA